MTIDLTTGIGNEVIYAIGLQITDDKGTVVTTDDVVVAATPVQTTTGSISLSHVDASHITSSDDNMAPASTVAPISPAGPLHTAENHQTIFDLVAGA